MNKKRSFKILVFCALLLCVGIIITLLFHSFSLPIAPLRSYELKQSSITLATSTDMLPTGIQKYAILSPEDQPRILGDLFLLEGDRASIDFISKPKHPSYFEPKINFSALQQDFAKDNKTVVLALAAAFTPDWKTIQGLALEHGDMVGAKHIHGFGSFLVLDNGKPSLVSQETITDADTFIASAKEKKLSLFEQLPSIENTTTTFSKSPGAFEYRFYVEIKKEEKTIPGFVIFHQEMKLKDAIHVLQSFPKNTPVHNALYLDAGALSQGYWYDTTGDAHEFIDEGVRKYSNRFTNLLVVYTKK